MSIPTISEDDCYEIALNGFRDAFRDADPPVDLSEDGFCGQLARSLVSSTYAVLVGVASADKDAIPQEGSSFEALSLWAVVLGLSNGTNPGAAPFGPLIPQAAKGGAAIPTGAGGTVVPDGSTLVDSSGQITLALYGAGTLPMGAGTSAQVNAVTTGAKGNLAAGTVLTWTSAPVGADPTVTLTAALSLGTDGETAANPAPLLARIRYRLQNPPGSGRASDFRTYAENSADANGTPFTGLRAYVYPLREGAGGLTVVPLLPGNGAARVPTTPQITAIQATCDKRRPVCSRGYVRQAKIQNIPSRAITVKVLALETLPKYAWDFDDGGGLTVDAWLTGPTRIQVPATLPASLTQAIDRYKARVAPAPRLQVVSTSGPEVPLVVTAIDYSAPAPATVTVVVPSGFVAPVANDMAYAGSPFATAAAQAILAHLNQLGPARGLFADPDDLWDDTVRISRLTQIVNDTLDEDGTRMCNVQAPALNGTQIAVGGGALSNRDVQARDFGIGQAPELLIAKRVLVVRS